MILFIMLLPCVYSVYIPQPNSSSHSTIKAPTEFERWFRASCILDVPEILVNPCTFVVNYPDSLKYDLLNKYANIINGLCGELNKTINSFNKMCESANELIDKETKLKIGLIVGLTIGVVLPVVLIICLCVVLKIHEKNKKSRNNTLQTPPSNYIPTYQYNNVAYGTPVVYSF